MTEKIELFLGIYNSEEYLISKNILTDLLYISHQHKRNLIVIDSPRPRHFRTSFRVYNSIGFYFDSCIERSIKEGSVKIFCGRKN